MSTTTRTLQPGQTYDPGYPVPDLAIGQRVGDTGRIVIAAVRQIDCPGYLPGLHIVTAYGPSAVQPYVTWEVAWQPFTPDELVRRAAAGQPDVTGRWVAGSGHYFYATQAREAMLDMLRRAGRAPGEQDAPAPEPDPDPDATEAERIAELYRDAAAEYDREV
jgi:hypothetical protein